MKKSYISPEINMRPFSSEDDVMLNIFSTKSADESVNFINTTTPADTQNAWTGRY